MKFGFEFWGLGIGLGGFGEVEARENAKEKPRILGLRGRAAARVLLAAAGSLWFLGAAAQGKFQDGIFRQF